MLRSHKTGQPKKYAFVEFEFADVAKIAAETMNNYLMFDKIVKCEHLAPGKVPKNLFKNWDRPFISTTKLHKTRHNQVKSDAKEYKLLCKRLKRVNNMKLLLAAQGIQFEPVIVNRPVGLVRPDQKAAKKPLEPEVVEQAEETDVVSTPSKAKKLKSSAKKVAPTEDPSSPDYPTIKCVPKIRLGYTPPKSLTPVGTPIKSTPKSVKKVSSLKKKSASKLK